MIVLDLEWNRGYDKTPLDEILQIGAVHMDRPGGRILDTFCVYIAPRVHRRLNRTAKALPEVEEALASPLDFPTAFGQFARWCGDETDFAAWGSDDFDTLEQNCTFWKVPPLPIRQIHDLQTAFALTLGTRQNLALWWAVEYCRIPECFTFHNALNDAVYTAIVSRWISPEALELVSLPRELLRFLGRSFPARPPRPVGPYPSLADGLNGRDSRKGACPVCGARIWIQQWSFAREGTYYAPLRCFRHGRFLCRLTLSPDQSGRWSGALETPVPAPPLLEDFHRASHAHTYICKGGKRRRRRRRRRSGRPAPAGAPV